MPLYLLQLFLHLTGFFLTALVCHQALAARRPAPRWLTEFYLLMSLGGVIGGSFNAFLAPLIFKTVLEYPLVLLAGLPGATLGAGLAHGPPASGHAVRRRSRRGRRRGADGPGRVLQSWGQAAAGGHAVIAAFLLRDRAPMFFLLCLTLVVGPRPCRRRNI